LNSDIVAFDFRSFGSHNIFPDVTDAVLFFDSSEVIAASLRAGMNSAPKCITTGSSALTTEDIDLVFTRLDDEVESAPEPSTLLRLDTLALAGGVFLRLQSKT